MHMHICLYVVCELHTHVSTDAHGGQQGWIPLKLEFHLTLSCQT